MVMKLSCTGCKDLQIEARFLLFKHIAGTLNAFNTKTTICFDSYNFLSWTLHVHVIYYFFTY